MHFTLALVRKCYTENMITNCFSYAYMQHEQNFSKTLWLVTLGFWPVFISLLDLRTLPKILKSQMFLLTSQTSSTEQSEPDTLTANTGPISKPVTLKTGLLFILTILFCSQLFLRYNLVTYWLAFIPWVNTLGNLVINFPN